MRPIGMRWRSPETDFASWLLNHGHCGHGMIGTTGSNSAAVEREPLMKYSTRSRAKYATRAMPLMPPTTVTIRASDNSR